MDGQQELSRGVRGNGVGLQGAGRACGAAKVSQTPLQRQSTAQGGGQPRGFWSQGVRGPVSASPSPASCSSSTSATRKGRPWPLPRPPLGPQGPGRVSTLRCPVGRGQLYSGQEERKPAHTRTAERGHTRGPGSSRALAYSCRVVPVFLTEGQRAEPESAGGDWKMGRFCSDRLETAHPTCEIIHKFLLFFN